MLGFVIGDSLMVTGFRLVGVEGAEVTSVDQAREALSNVFKRSDIAIVILSEEFSSQMQDEIENMRSNRITPLIVEVPGSSGTEDKNKISELLSKTLGVRF